MENKTFTRRLFCKGMAITPFLPITSLVGIIGCATAPIYRGNLIEGRISVQQEELARRIEISKVFIMQISELEYPIIVVQKGADSYHALSVRCTHQGCHVRPSGETLTCPCHGSTYDLEGKVVRGPAKAALQRFEIVITTDGIEVIVDSTGNNSANMIQREQL